MAPPPDEPIDRLLRLSSRQSEMPADSACPDAELLAAYADRSLPADEAVQVERHAAACPRCTHILALVASSDIARVPADTATAPWWTNWRWAVPAATAATIAAVWVSTVQPPTRSALESPSARSEEPAAVAPAPIAEPPRAPAALADVQERDTLTRSRTSARDEARQSRRQAAVAEKSAEAPPPARSEDRAAAQETSAGLAVTARQALSSRRAAYVEVTTPDPSRRWRALGGAIERTTDAGASWLQEHESQRRVLAGVAVAANEAWLVGEQGLVLRRTANGWTESALPAAANVTAVEAADINTATVRLADGRAFRTADGGATWMLIP